MTTKRVLIGGLFLLAVIGAVVYVILQKKALNQYRGIIETVYASEIALIEQRAKELPDPDDNSEASRAHRDAIAAELRTALSKPEVFAASWTLDGHHGLHAIKPMNTDGYSNYFRWFGSQDPEELHSLYYGKTFEGEGLLVYQGWVPTGVNKSYRIAFYRSAIREETQK